MKRKQKSLIIMLICVILIAGLSTETNASLGISLANLSSENIEKTETLAEIRTVVDNYMEARYTAIVSGKTLALERVSVIGIVNDELAHKDLLNSKKIRIDTSEYEIVNVEYCDTETNVTLTESYTYSQEGVLNISHNEHILTLMESNEVVYVVSDKYREVVSGFTSCSFITETQGETHRYIIEDVQSIAEVAISQVGYLEKASNSNLESFTANAGSNNYTKYGAWYGNNGDDWCAQFVSWCANEVGISQTMLPKFESCDTGMQFFKTNGRFVYSPAYGGSQMPSPGDIFFQGVSSTDATHVGIVISVSGTTMTIVDGNCNNQVRQHTMSINDSSLIGFGDPCTHTRVLKMDSMDHWYACSECGITMSFPANHTMSTIGNAQYHWINCTGCTYQFLAPEPHTYSSSGYCLTCGRAKN